MSTHKITPPEAKKQPKMMKIVAVVPRKNGGDGDGESAKGFWTRIGVAFENRDGSMNLRFDYWPTSPETTIQLRPFDPPREGAESTTI